MIRGTKRPMPRPAAAQTLDFRASIHNRFDVEVLDAATGELKQRARGYNVICDALWDKLLASSNGWWTPQNYFMYVLYGSGSGTPDPSDTTLFTKLAAIMVGSSVGDHSAVEIVVDRENSVAYGRAVVVIQAEEAVGETITEVGIGYDDTHVVTHALLQDMNGNPISIEKTATDVIKIYATIFLHWPVAAFYAGSVNLAEPNRNETSDFTIFRVLFGRQNYYNTKSAFGVESAFEAIRTGGSPGDRVTTTTVDRANKKLAITYRFPATADNRPIRYIGIALMSGGNLPGGYGSASRAVSAMIGSWFTPPTISGEAIGTGDGTTKDFITAFPVRSGATVKVNGAAASGVTVRTGAPDGTMAHKWINAVLGVSEGGAVLYPYSWSTYGGEFSEWICGYWDQNGGETAFENPFYSVGIGSLMLIANGGPAQLDVKASDDFETWIDVGTLTWPSGYNDWRTLAVPAALQSMRFFKVIYTTSRSGYNYVRLKAAVPGTAPETNVHFDTPPAAGSVITADYVPDCIAKDKNHVFDLTLELTLGEYSEG